MDIQQRSFASWWKSVRGLFSRGGEFRRNPKMSWRIILSIFSLGIASVLIIGYLTYYNAISGEDVEMPATASRSALRTTDVRSVIEIYQKKKERLSELRADRPTFPSPTKGASIQTKSETDSATSSTSTLPLR